MLLLPLARIQCVLAGVRWGEGWKFYGLPIIQKHRRSTLTIGARMELRSTARSNPLGANRPSILSTRRAGAVLQIGEGFGIEAAVRWLKDDRVGLEFAHETRIECDPEERAELLLEVIRRSFDEQDIQFAPEEDYGPGFAAESGQDLGKRDERRHPLIWVGEIHYAHDTNPTRLRNVSEGGALIDVAADYPPGAEVLLDLAEGGQVFGTIVWTCGDQAGLRFKEPFDIGCLAKVRPQLMPTNWRAPTFLEDGADGDSPWNENWSRSSLAEMRSELEGYLKR
jgi:hypothetical protein